MAGGGGGGEEEEEEKEEEEEDDVITMGNRREKAPMRIRWRSKWDQQEREIWDKNPPARRFFDISIYCIDVYWYIYISSHVSIRVSVQV